ncbi:MAG TPA: hypothetical protein VJR89_10845 [Polyangiales bacterium]|nr:hypothetical protein [Polyangiales bacterium]
MSALLAGCSDGSGDAMSAPVTTAGAGAGSGGSTLPAAGSGQSTLVAGSTSSGGTAGSPSTSAMQAGRSGQSGTGSTARAGSGGAGNGAAGAPAAGSGGAAGGMMLEAKCGANDTPEKGLQGDVNTGTVNCGLTLLSEIPGGGHVQGSGHCAYVRSAGSAPYTGSKIKAYSLADPLKPMQTDEETAVGGSESMRAHTVEGRAILVSGKGVYDVSTCEDMVKKGEIAWPSQNAQNGLFFAALSSHEISISHDAKRVYSGLGFAVADIANLEQPNTWTVKNWSCEMNKQSGFPEDVPNACDGPSQPDVGRQYSHSSDDNLEGTVWYGANQEGSSSQMEPPTARMVDISDPNRIEILDTVVQFPGHSMNWWRTPDGREFILGANEGLGVADTCVKYPRPTSLGNALDAYIVEVTGKKFGKPFSLTLDINKPENCQAAKASGANASITEHTVYNEHGAAFAMIEFGRAGLRVFDLRDGEHPKEVAYYNDGKGHVHSGVFHYDAARGIMLASGAQAVHVLMLQPQMIAALGLPTPTDPGYPYQ